jgi:6-phosphogluconolactonase
VANAASNNVSGYTIDPSTGALTAIASPFPAGTFPVSVAVDPSGKFAYVANTGQIGQNGSVSGYTINQSSGALTPIGPAVTAGINPESVAVDPSGKFVYVANFGTALSVSPSPGTVSGYTIDPTTGALAPITGSPFAAGNGANFVAVDPRGKFAYVANSVDDTVSGYTIDPTTGALMPFTSSPVSTTSPFSVAVDPSGKFAYVANFTNSGTVSGFTIDPASGALTPFTSSPVSAGAEPDRLAVDPSGKFVYVGNFSSSTAPSTVSGFTINPATGALAPITGSPFAAGSNPVSVAVAITRQVLFASSFAKLEINAGGFDLNESFTLGKNSNGINPVTENVTLQIGTFSVTIPPGSFKKNPNGRFAFQGVIKGVNLQFQIVPLGNNIFTFKAEGTGVNLTGLTNPVTVVLTIGMDSGTTTRTAQF